MRWACSAIAEWSKLIVSLLLVTWLNNSKCMLPGHLVATHLSGFDKDAACLCIKIAVLVQYIRSLLTWNADYAALSHCA